MTHTPRLLRAHHLKALRLPTFLREYGKVARQCADEDIDHSRYLLRFAELERIDRERRLVERRIRECPIFCVSVNWSMLPEMSKDGDDFQGTIGRASERLRAA